MPSNASDRYDLAVAGAGVFGLSVACAALKAGLKVLVLEADTVGAGASGGLLGALMPHMPARWNAKKEFQFQALTSLQDHVQALESETGLQCGYKRLGRILPLTTQDKLDHHRERAAESQLRWQPEATGFSYKVEAAGSRSDWLSADAAPFGIVFETCAARIAPRRYLKALAESVRHRGTLKLNARAVGFDEETGRISLQGGTTAWAKSIVFAGGFSTFKTIERLTGEQIGRGEKGQALLLAGQGLSDRPAIYCDGLYVVPHDDGTVAIGSTADRTAQDTEIDPARSADLVQRATAFCPSLAGRQVLCSWAGIRPRCNRRDPLIGRLPGFRHIYAATGGFKISFGIAHLIAEALIAEVVGEDPKHPLPDTFRPANHFGANRLEADI